MGLHGFRVGGGGGSQKLVLHSGYIIGLVLYSGLCRDNGKEHGYYYFGFRIWPGTWSGFAPGIQRGCKAKAKGDPPKHMWTLIWPPVQSLNAKP